MRNLYLTAMLAIIVLPLSAHTAEVQRWYSDDQVKDGEKVFTNNCATCHGKSAEATSEWKKRDAKGNLVPPPLNGTAHAWHHPMKLLRRTVRKGGQPVGGTMPAFKDKLSEAEIDSAIAWFQSKWSDEIYTRWYQRNADTGFQSVTSKPQKHDPLTQLLRQRLRGVDISPPKSTEIKGLHQSKVGADYVYLFEKGRYALIGELIDLKTGKNLTELAKGKDKLKLLKSFPESDMVIYPATGQVMQSITILTDTDCPFCRKLHREVPALQKASITVRYIAFPRGGKQASSYTDMKSVWCAKDRASAMSIAKGMVEGDLEKSNCAAASAVDRGYEFGLKIGLRGTPAIIFENGKMAEGYVPASKLISLSRSNQNK